MNLFWQGNSLGILGCNLGFDPEGAGTPGTYMKLIRSDASSLKKSLT